MSKTFQEKLEAFAALVQADQLAGLIRDGVDCEPNRNNCIPSIKPGKLYTKVDVGGSGKYMVVNATGEIFGIKAYGVINKGRSYGILDTINDWYWDRYAAYRKNSSYPAHPSKSEREAALANPANFTRAIASVTEPAGAVVTGYITGGLHFSTLEGAKDFIRVAFERDGTILGIENAPDAPIVDRPAVNSLITALEKIKIAASAKSFSAQESADNLDGLVKEIFTIAAEALVGAKP